MNQKEFLKLSPEQQNALASKYGITRSGVNNQKVAEADLIKIPDEKPKEKISEPVVEAPVKSSDKPRVIKRSKSRKSK